jgi:glucose dehydrogenase
MVFAGQADGSVVALNAKTGVVKWTAQVASVGTYGKKSMPISIPFTVYTNGIVLTGINGGDSPLRGHIDALNASNGNLMWRFFTLPGLSNPEIHTWGNPAEAATGGAAIWSIPAVDPQLNRVYVGTGNAFPYTGRAAGQSLWANSEVSLNLKTGALKWFYQAVHHDEWDYDCPTPPVLYNATVNGVTHQAIAFSCKSGYIYILDRATGQPIFPIPETPVPNLDNGVGATLNKTWATQPTPTGGEAQILPHCPTPAQVTGVLPGYPKAPNGTPYVLTCPYAPTNATHYTAWGPYFAFGGTDYPPMSYDPVTNDLYVCANVTYQSMENKTPHTQDTTYLTGGGWTTHGESGTVTALNVSTNKLDWQVQYNASNNGACYSGALSTAGGLVFVASRGQTSGVPKPFGGALYAYSAKTGKPLFSYRNSSLIMAPAITYSVKGKQYVAVDMTAGTNTVSLPGFGALTTSTRDKLMVFSLP